MYDTFIHESKFFGSENMSGEEVPSVLENPTRIMDLERVFHNQKTTQIRPSCLYRVYDVCGFNWFTLVCLLVSVEPL